RKVTYELTGNELIALLKENDELQRIRPRYNSWHARRKTGMESSENVNNHDYNTKSLKDFLIVDKGRETGEKSVVWIGNGRLKGVGFFDLNHQINNIHILESIITPIHDDQNAKKIIETYLKTKKGYKIIDLNQKN
ncbi:MAG: DNA polymerase III subunit epsilon, partial [Flavobacteriaceae bacterium]